MPPIVTSSQNRSNTCIRGFLGCVATNYVTPQLVPLLETVRTVVPANTIFSFPMAGFRYSKTFIDEVMPSPLPFTGRARSCPPIMTFWYWIRPSMASCFSFCLIFLWNASIGVMHENQWSKLRTKAEKPDALNLCCFQSEEMQLKVQASCCMGLT